MTREEQKINREFKKRLPQEIRKLNKKYNLQYAHEFLYRFEGDFLYIGMPAISSIKCGLLSNTVEIKPWVLDEIYWKVHASQSHFMFGECLRLDIFISINSLHIR